MSTSVKTPKNNECRIYKDTIKHRDHVLCEGCGYWYHPKCLNLNPVPIRKMPIEEPWFCPQCKPTDKTLADFTDSVQNTATESVNNVASDPTDECPGDDNVATTLDENNQISTDNIDEEGTNDSSSSVSELESTDEEGYSEHDQCGSSAAIIAIEFQRFHKTGHFPSEIVASKSIMERIRLSLHKEPSQKLNNWKPVRHPSKESKVRCDKCGKKWQTRNRGVLNLHKCPIDVVE